MPDSVYSLGNYTFMNCASLKECKLSKKLSYLSSAMFLGCSSLEELNLPAGIRTLGTLETADAFENTNSLKAVHVDPNNRYLKSVDGVVFDGNGKTLRLYPMAKTETTYTIPEGVTRLARSLCPESQPGQSDAAFYPGAGGLLRLQRLRESEDLRVPWPDRAPAGKPGDV